MAKVKKLNTPVYIIGFTAFVCLIAAIIVGGAVTLLRPRQQLNERVYLEKSLLEVAGIPYAHLTNKVIADTVDQRFVPFVIDMSTGLVTNKINPKTYNAVNAIKSSKTSIKLSSSEDIAKIRAVPNYQVGYFVKDTTGKVTLVLLPINGSGLWSMLWGYLAVDMDGETIHSIVFYKQEETPGLGARVQDPKWVAQWHGKKIYSEDGHVKIAVIKNASGNNPYVVDGISGATLTSKGVSNLMKFWMGSIGYKRFLMALKNGKINTNV